MMYVVYARIMGGAIHWLLINYIALYIDGWMDSWLETWANVCPTDVLCVSQHREWRRMKKKGMGKGRRTGQG